MNTTDTENFTIKEMNLLQKNIAFFERYPNYFNILKNINLGLSNITLRLIDCFIATYSKSHNQTIYDGYLCELIKYKKAYFDPFRRHNKLIYNDVETSIGQLNFFRWMFENDVMKYIDEHYN